MFRLVRFVSIAAFVLALGSVGFGDAVQAHHARVELVSPQNRLTPGRQLWLGLHFSLEKDWHIYWTNPGDSGTPPVLQWRLPRGFSAGEILWPLPEKLKRSTLADYGYENDVVLLVPIHIPADLKLGGRENLNLDLKWLICSDACIPDKAQLHLSLPVASSAAEPSNQASIIADARRRIPKPWPSSWKAQVSAEKDDFVLTITAGKTIRSAQFFPLSPDEIENAAPQPLQSTPGGVRVTLRKSDQLLKPVPVLKGLLVLEGGEAYAVAAPVDSNGLKGRQ